MSPCGPGYAGRTPGVPVAHAPEREELSISKNTFTALLLFGYDEFGRPSRLCNPGEEATTRRPAGALRISASERRVMSDDKQYVEQKEFNPSGPLGQIPDLIKTGTIPSEFQPRTDEDFAAIGRLQRKWAAPAPNLLSSIATVNVTSFPPDRFWHTLATLAYPLLNPDAPLAQQLAVAWDARLNLDGLDRQTCNSQEITILAARLKNLFKQGPPMWSSEVSIYNYLAVCQTALIHVWPDFSSCTARGASVKTMFKWFFTAFTIALTMQARAMLEALFVGIGTATPGLPQRAADWLLGRTDDPDAFVAAQARIYSWDNEWMQELSTQWAQIPPGRLRQAPDEPRARDCLSTK